MKLIGRELCDGITDFSKSLKLLNLELHVKIENMLLIDLELILVNGLAEEIKNKIREDKSWRWKSKKMGKLS